MSQLPIEAAPRASSERTRRKDAARSPRSALKKAREAPSSTKARILATAEEVFATKGFAGASTREGLDRTNLVASKCVVAVLDGDMPPTGCTVADGRRSRPAIAGEPPDRT